MLISNGSLVTKTPTFPFTPATTSDWFYDYERVRSGLAYGSLYKRQLWVYVVVSKRARGVARLPLKTYFRDDLNRPEAREHPYGRLLRDPNPAISPFRFWEWTSSTYDVYGEAFWFKRRDASGVPHQLVPLHPTGMTLRDDGRWDFQNTRGRLEDIDSADLVHFRSYNPTNTDRGLSALEPLRDTLENEANARTATSSFWARGARPGTALTHPNNLSAPAQARLKAQFDAIAAGSGKTGTTVVLEEGMTPTKLDLSAEEAQYIETRKLNREEVCGAYDVPPPVVHILDRATFSNITEQMRSMYRDTMAPHLKGFEADMETQLRAPDFGDDVYAEFLLDEVLRGDFEARAEAYAKADHMTIAEKRRAENLPFIAGTDRIFINAANVPLPPPPSNEAEPPPPPFQQVGLPALIDAGVLTPQDGRDLLQIPGTAPGIPAPMSTDGVRSVLGRLAWQKSLDDVDPATLTAGLNGHTAPVLSALSELRSAGGSVADLRARVKTILEVP